MTMAAEQRPILRGWSHAVAIAPAAGGAAVLTVLARGDVVKQLTLIVYGVALTLLFTVSALYHRGGWSPRAKALWRRIDHADIHVMIAATYTPITVQLLSGAARIVILSLIWIIALGGSAIALSGVSVRRGILVSLYIATGWLAVVVMPALYSRVGAGGLAMLGAGGVLYSLGAFSYALRRPLLWPRVFSYHEVFHLFVIAASAVFFGFIALNVVPAGRL